MRTILYLAILIGLAACGAKGSSSNPSNDTPTEGEPFALLLQPEPKGKTYPEAEKMAIAFAQLKKSCLESGNTFNDRDMVCLCPASDVPVSFSLKTTSDNPKDIEPSCVRHERQMPPEGYATFSQLLAEDKDEFIRSTAIMGGNRQRFMVDSHFHMAEQAKDQAYAKIAAALDAEPLHLKTGPRFRWFGIYDIHIGWDYPEESEQGLLASFVKSTSGFNGTPGRTRMERRGIRLIGFVNDPANISRVLSAPVTGRQGWDFAEPDSNDPNFNELRDLRTATGVVNSLLRGEITRLPEQLDRVIIMEDGCHLRCITTTEFAAAGSKFRYEKLYVYGEILATRISRFTGDSYFAGMSFSSSVLFGQGRLPAIVTVNRKSTAGLAAGWQVDVYDEEVRKVTTFSEQHVDDEPLLISNLNLTDDSVADAAPVIMMDEIIDYRDQRLMRYIKKGPFRTTSYTKGGSAFGWFDAAPGDERGYNYTEFYDGLLDHSYRLHKDSFYHSSFVGRLIAGIPEREGETSVVPVSYTADIARPNILDKILTMSGSRIVNNSTLLLRDGQNTCPLNNYQLDERAIWVSGAGNDGLVDPEDGCYQNMTPSHRRIVVAANYEGSTELTDYSDRGRRYADISASGVAYDRHGKKSEGTSYAAPRVSQVAGVLVKRFGDQLSNQHIRLAILLSATVDVGRRSETRTGGALDRDAAIRAGQYMYDVIKGKIKLPQKLTKKNVMYRIIEASGALTDQDQISNQVEWLIEGGI